MNRTFIFFLMSILFLSIVGFFSVQLGIVKNPLTNPIPSEHIMEFKSIDTMKYSRDLSKEKLKDPLFDETIDRQVSNIANTGATYIAIATPYDEEFLPMLRRWVASARKYKLKVWFRGNFSGWEKWFGYEKITRDEHIIKTEQFILTNKDLFEDGDVVTACPECENGGPGDPRKTGDVKGHRQFLIDEYKVTKASFLKIGKKISSNYNSMNADVARLVMDKKTTEALDKIVVIDHYVNTPEKLASDIREIAKNSGGDIVLGEFGVPIPDINGNMTEDEQAQWLDKALGFLTKMEEVAGVSYWVNVGGSTQLWDSKGNARKAVDVITKYYKIHSGSL